MALAFNCGTIRSRLNFRLPRVGHLSKSLLLGVGAGIFGLMGSASAAETILLRFEETQVSVPIRDVEAFAESGAVTGALQEFFQKYPEIQSETQEILDRKITVTEAFIQRTLSGSTGEFVLIQLRKLLSNPSDDSDIESLRSTLIDAYEDDNRFSVLELLQKYPEEEIYVDVRGLQQVYGDVVAFVERIQPILETAREYLQDLVCDCPTPAASGGGSTSSTATKSANCVPAAVTTPRPTRATVPAAQGDAAPTVSTTATVSATSTEESAIASPQPLTADTAVPTEPAVSPQPALLPDSK